MGKSTSRGLVCDYCGATKEQVTFFIGAKRSDHVGWCMVEGTGNMACDVCYPTAIKEGVAAIDRYIETVNAACKGANR